MIRDNLCEIDMSRLNNANGFSRTHLITKMSTLLIFVKCFFVKLNVKKRQGKFNLFSNSTFILLKVHVYVSNSLVWGGSIHFVPHVIISPIKAAENFAYEKVFLLVFFRVLIKYQHIIKICTFQLPTVIFFVLDLLSREVPKFCRTYCCGSAHVWRKQSKVGQSREWQ